MESRLQQINLNLACAAASSISHVFPLQPSQPAGKCKQRQVAAEEFRAFSRSLLATRVIDRIAHFSRHAWALPVFSEATTQSASGNLVHNWLIDQIDSDPGNVPILLPSGAFRLHKRFSIIIIIMIIIARHKNHKP